MHHVSLCVCVDYDGGNIFLVFGIFLSFDSGIRDYPLLLEYLHFEILISEFYIIIYLISTQTLVRFQVGIAKCSSEEERG